MGSLVEVGLANALVAGVLAIVALLAGRFSRRPAMAHALWLIVLLKLITPPVVSLPVPWWEAPAPVVFVDETPDEPEPVDVFIAPTPVVQEFVLAPEEPPPMRIQDLIPGADGKLPVVMPVVPKVAPNPRPIVEKAVAPPARVVKRAVKRQAVAPPPPSQWPGISNLIGVVWVVGAGLWFLVAAYRILRFQRLLRHARSAPAELQGQATLLARQMGMSRGPQVSLIPGPIPPMLWRSARRRVSSSRRSSCLASTKRDARRCSSTNSPTWPGATTGSAGSSCSSAASTGGIR